MCRLRNIAIHDYQESVTTGHTDAGQSDPYVPLCSAGDTELRRLYRLEQNKIIHIHFVNGAE